MTMENAKSTTRSRYESLVRAERRAWRICDSDISLARHREVVARAVGLSQAAIRMLKARVDFS